MERLTVRRRDGRWAIANPDNAKPMERMSKLSVAIDRLAAYENTGLDPENIPTGFEMAKMKFLLDELQEYRAIGSIDRLRELAQADREGRLFITMWPYPSIQKGEKVQKCESADCPYNHGEACPAADGCEGFVGGKHERY